MKKVLGILILVSSFNLNATAKKAIVIGASSGMGRQVAKFLALDGYEVGLAARRMELLDTLAEEIPTKTYKKRIDVSQYEQATEQLLDLIDEMGGLDLIVISVSGTNDSLAKSGELRYNPADAFINDKRTLDVDLLGFWHMADTAREYFELQGHGHLVGISSTSGLIGSASSPVYSASKAFIQRYLEAIRNKMVQTGKKDIFITDIVPGYVEVEAEDLHKLPHAYWIAKADEAGRQIVAAIKAKKARAYITARWELVAWAYQLCPNWLYNKIGGF